MKWEKKPKDTSAFFTGGRGGSQPEFTVSRIFNNYQNQETIQSKLRWQEQQQKKKYNQGQSSVGNDDYQIMAWVILAPWVE